MTDTVIESAESLASESPTDQSLRTVNQAAWLKLLEELGNAHQREFDEAKTYRLETERRWIKDLRQYKGIYDPEVMAALKEKKRSMLYLRLSRAKVKSLNARLADMLFPAGDKNWTITATPMPTIDEAMYAEDIQRLKMRSAETGEQLDKTAIDKAIREVAREAAEKMEKTVDDQLEEGSYEAKCRKVIASGNLFGTGVLKGPLGSPQMVRKWKRINGEWTLEDQKIVKPHFEFTPVWYYYPDPLATDREQCRYEFEARPTTASDLARLKRDDAYIPEQIDKVLSTWPTGNANQLEEWEVDLRDLSKDQQNKPNPTGRFRILERWGYVSGAALKATGLPVEDENIDYEAQVWQVGNVIIRIDINPFDSGSRPFKLFYFDKDESSIWGEGLPSILRDTERGANTSVRAMVDNAAMSAVPNIEVNTRLMPDEVDLNTFTAGRVWHRAGSTADAQYPAVRILEIPNQTEKFAALLKLFMELGDEVSTVPRFTYGGTDGASVSKTVGGLSMLMGQANISLKDLAKNWDDGITEPFIGDCYDWNMQFNDDAEIKGDHEVTARGSSSLVAKEIRANALAGFTADLIQMAPNLAKVRDLFSERARNLDLDPDMFLKTDEEADAENVEKQMGMAAMQTVDTLAKAMGLPPEQLVQNIDQIILQMQAVAQEVGGALDAAGIARVPVGQAAPPQPMPQQGVPA